jgi:hypothetical protein
MQNFLQWFVFMSFMESLSTGLHLKSSKCTNYEVFIEILKFDKLCYNIFGILYDEYILKCITIIVVKFRLYPSGRTKPSLYPSGTT